MEVGAAGGSLQLGVRMGVKFGEMEDEEKILS